MEIELSSGVLADLTPTVGARRGVVLVPDLLGRRPLFAEMAERLAIAHDWNVIVADPFRGQQFPPGVTEARYGAVSELDDNDVVGDLVDAAERLEVEPVALIGFGLGGMYAFKAAASHRFDRLVSVSGHVVLPEAWKGPGQREPLRLIEHAADPNDILACYGRADHEISAGDVEQLAAAGVEVVFYEDADHDFVQDPANANHRPTDAADVWARVVKHLSR